MAGIRKAGIGVSLLVPIPGWAAVTNWFHKQRGLAMGILSGAIGLGGIVVYLINHLVARYGWRATVVILGFGTIQGASMAVMMLGTTAGPLLTGLFYDLHQTYRPIWLLMGGLMLVSIPFALRLKPPPDLEASKTDA